MRLTYVMWFIIRTQKRIKKIANWIDFSLFSQNKSTLVITTKIMSVSGPKLSLLILKKVGRRYQTKLPE
jgi:hypothetical protein